MDPLRRIGEKIKRRWSTETRCLELSSPTVMLPVQPTMRAEVCLRESSTFHSSKWSVCVATDCIVPTAIVSARLESHRSPVCLFFVCLCQVDDSAKDTQLVQHLIHTEAPVFLVVASSLYRALTVAAGSQHITQWYPRIVSKVRAEVQEGLHGFIRWLNSNSTRVS